MDFSSIKNIISFISQFCVSPISYIRELEENLNTLRTSIEEMKDVRDDVRARVKTQEANRMRRTHQVAGWLARVDAMEDQVEGILKEGYEDIGDRFLGGFLPANCYASYKLGEKVVRKIKDVDELKGQERGFEIVAEALPPALVQEMPAVPALGMDLMLEKAWSCISKERVGIMGIYGIGGVGKTTLLKRINNEFLSRQIPHFDVVIWVVVSKEVNAKKIQDDVAKRLGLSLPEDEILHDRALTLHSELSKKTFVLLLDDIWEPMDLTAIGIPPPDIKNKSKVLFTTRFEDVCGQMKTREKIKVECLDSAEAWKLFQEEVGDEALNSHPEIPAIAKQVAEECGGLPLALITTSKAMACTKTPQEWRHQLNILKKSASEFSGMEDKVYSILKFSYDRLPDNTIRSCFVYCSLFPEDHSIEIEQLIRYWIGEGFLDGFDDIDEVENKGYAIIGILKRACLLESSLDSPGTEVKMHDVLRDLALWIGCDDGRKKNKLLVQAGVCLAEVPKVGKWREAERISLMDNNLKTLGEEAPECPKLLSLILSRNFYLINICHGFFQYMHVLKVLDLSNARINVLPTSIVELVELEYLGLANTHIKMLPPEMKNLVKLKCLDLSHTNLLEFIPCGILSRFSRLQVLDLSGSKFEHWEAKSDDIGQDEGNVGASIKELECLRDLQDLSINIKKVACLHRILASQELARCTRQFYIKDCEILIPENLKYRSLSKIHGVTIDNCEFKDLSWLDGSRNIDFLGIYSCMNIKVICDGIAGCFTNLTHVRISHCDALKDLSSLRGSTNLEFLEICHCKGLRVGITGGCFPKLDSVEITECEALKDLSWLRGAPHLRVLMIDYCDGLQQICDGTAGCFPNLRKVNITGCNALKDLSWLCGAPNLKKLFVNSCECLELICDGTAGCFPNLRLVHILNCNALKDLSWLCGAPNLENLLVSDYECLELISKGTAGCFPNLYELKICDCYALKDLSWLCDAPNLEKLLVSVCECLELICDGTVGCFPNLREVHIEGCDALKDLSWLCGAPNLEKLSVLGCECLELICDGEDEEVKESPLKFSCLSSLCLDDLPELKRIPWHAIPPGTRTTIKNCPKATPPNEHQHLESNVILG